MATGGRSAVDGLVMWLVPLQAQAYATGCYNRKEIAQAFEIHYATANRIVKKLSTMKMYECKT